MVRPCFHITILQNLPFMPNKISIFIIHIYYSIQFIQIDNNIITKMMPKQIFYANQHKIAKPLQALQKEQTDSQEQSFYSIKNDSSHFAEPQHPLSTILEIQPSQTIISAGSIVNNAPTNDQYHNNLMRKKVDARSPICGAGDHCINIQKSNIELSQSNYDDNDSMHKEGDQEISSIQSQGADGGQKQTDELSLLNDIQCLKFAEISPSQLKEIKQKIELLKSQQNTLQTALTMAQTLLKSTKQRNQIVEEQLKRYKDLCVAKNSHNMEAHDPFRSDLRNGEKVTTKLIREGNKMQGQRQKRSFPQSNMGQSRSGIDTGLKNLFRKCSLHQQCCLLRNEFYEVNVRYSRIRQGEWGSDKLLVVIKLNVFPHIQKQSKYRFELSNETEQPVRIDKLLNNGVCQEFSEIFSAWQNRKNIFNVSIFQIDQRQQIVCKSDILVPLPITHFLEPRCGTINPKMTSILTEKVLSEYQTNLSGKMIEEEWADQVKETWWNAPNMLIGCLGWHEVCCLKLEKEEGKGWKVRVYGKKGSALVIGLMEFMTFYLMS